MELAGPLRGDALHTRLWLLALPGRAGHGRPLRILALTGTHRANEDTVMSVKPDGITEITQ